MPNSEEIKGNWNEMKGKLKSKSMLNLPKMICYSEEGRDVGKTTAKTGQD
jgi:hypothetical protein